MNKYLSLIKILIIIFTLIIITYTDIKYRTIPDKVLLTILIPGIVLNLIINNLTTIDMILGFLIGGGSLFFIAVISGGGIGGGDIKLMTVMGMLLGLDSTVKALSISFILSGFISLILIIFKVKHYKDSIVLGPYLSLGILCSLLLL